MEEFSARRFSSTRMLQTELARLEQVLPAGDITPDTAGDRSRRIEGTREEWMRKIFITRQGDDRNRLILPLEKDPPGENTAPDPVADWHFFLKTRWQKAPVVMFAGGSATFHRIIFFRSPLNNDDFLTLWSDPLEA